MAVLAELTPRYFLANMKCRQPDYLDRPTILGIVTNFYVGRRSGYDGFVGAPSSKRRKQASVKRARL